MKIIVSLMVFCLTFIMIPSAMALAVEPVVSKNVHVLQNAKPAQCPTSFRSRAGTSTISGDTGMGMTNSPVGAGVRTCSRCSIDNKSGDCVCAVCFDYFN